MSTDRWSERILIACPPPEPQAGDEIPSMTSVIAGKPCEDLILDLSRADTLKRATLRDLIAMQRALARHGRRLALCNVGPLVLSALSSHNLDKVLHVAGGSEIALSPPMEPGGEGTLVLAVGRGGGHMERRKCVRLHTADSRRIEVHIRWQETGCGPSDGNQSSWLGLLVDISAAGAQVAIETDDKSLLEQGSIIELRFVDGDMAENPILQARVSEVRPVADGNGICLGLEFNGLEADPVARRALRQLCDSQTRYYETTECAVVD